MEQLSYEAQQYADAMAGADDATLLATIKSHYDDIAWLPYASLRINIRDRERFLRMELSYFEPEALRRGLTLPADTAAMMVAAE